MSCRYALALFLVLFVSLGLLSTKPVSAHEGRPLFIEIDQLSEYDFRVAWQLPPRLMNTAGIDLVLSIPGADATAAECLTARNQNQLGPAARGQRLYRCIHSEISDSSQPKSSESSNAATPELALELKHRTTNPGVATLLRVLSLTGESRSQFYSADQTQIQLNLDSNSNAGHWSYLKQGLTHIAEGYDHLLFVACLLFIAGGWRRVLLIVSGFTLAHSLTLALSALGFVKVAIAPVEATIALSIAFLASEILRESKETLTWRHPVLIALGFGLLHGFGFASALGEIGLPVDERLSALLLFNLGVELGQLIFIALISPLLWVLLQLKLPVKKISSYAIGTVAMFWFWQRLFV